MFNYLKNKMVIFELIGGLGNQMFQYAAARSLSLRMKTSLRLDISTFESYKLHQGFELGRVFNAPIDVAGRHDLKRILGWKCHPNARRFLTRSALKVIRGKNFVVEPHFDYWPEINRLNNNCYLSGYWQSEKYFIDYSEQIRSDFTFKLPLNEENLKLLDQINQVNSVSLHIRRGDYISNPKAAEVHGTCPLDYYNSAVKHIAEKIECPNFFIFSDDILWAKKNLKIDYPHEFLNGNQGAESYNDMRIMSMCKHNIIANSSFSWWGAWLNSNPNKIVVAPNQWFAKGDKTKDLIPSEWVRI